MTSEIVFITGANSGLGLETVKSLVQSSKPYTILLGSRNLAKGNAAAEELKRTFAKSQSTIEVVEIDIDDDESITQAHKTIESKFGRLDVLINNAGASFDQGFAAGQIQTVRELWNKSWNTNVAGTYVVTNTVVPLLLKSTNPRLLFITSGTSSLEENTTFTKIPVNQVQPAGWPKQSFNVAAYRSSKTGLNMQMREWYRMLKNDGVKVFGISPGMLATGLGGNPELLKKMGALDPSVGANFIRDVVEGARDDDVGKVIRKEMVQPW